MNDDSKTNQTASTSAENEPKLHFNTVLRSDDYLTTSADGTPLCPPPPEAKPCGMRPEPVFEQQPILPVNIEAEKAIFGAILLDRDNILIEQTGSLTRNDFSLDSNRRIWGKIALMRDEGTPIDFVTLAEELRQSNELDAIGGLAYLTSLTDGLPQLKNVEHYVRIVRELAGKRHAIHSAEALMHAVRNGIDIGQLAERFTEIGQHISHYDIGVGLDLSQFADPLEMPTEPEPWLLEKLIVRGGITTIAGAPGDGKTWQGLAIARAAAFGGDYLGLRCRQTPVVYLDGENPRNIIQSRWRVVFRGPIKGRVSYLPFWSEKPVPKRFDDPTLLAIAKTGGLIIFDTLSAFHQARNEDASAEMGPEMKKVRALANAGTSILLLHHRGKNELSKYPGSSAIAAGSDIVATLLKGDDGMLTLDVFKTRGSAEYKLNIRPDYESGKFQLVDSPVATQQRDDIAALVEAIAAEPGITQNQLIIKTRLNRNRACALLRQYDGKLWCRQPGPKRSLCYYLIASGTSGIK